MSTTLAELAQSYELNQKRMQEELNSLRYMLQSRWIPLLGGSISEAEGPSLDQIKEASRRNRELLLNPWVGGGNELIASYVWAEGIHYDGVPGSSRGRGVNVQGRIDKPINQRNFYGPLARKKRQTAFYCEGIVLYVGDDANYDIHQLSITDVEDDYRNPEWPDEIWAYRRRYEDKNVLETSPNRIKHEWIFVNEFLDKRPKGRTPTLEYKGVAEPVSATKRIFVKTSNPVVGWAYGLPDVQRGLQYAGDYDNAINSGLEMNAAMASILGQIRHNSQDGANNAAIQMGGMQQGGAFAHTGINQDMSVFATAGQSYDFAKSLPVLAAFAAGIGVSVIALSMNSGNAGGSYGAARSLERPEQLSTKARRSYNAELDREVLEWMGAKPEDLEVWFDPIEDPAEIYRAEQAIELRLGTGLHEGIDIKRMHAKLDGRDPNKVKPVPRGWLIPNNRESVELRTIDPNTNTSGNPANGGNFTPTQGSGAGLATGSGDQNADDIRASRESVIKEAILAGLSRTGAELMADRLIG